jgi:hypothetical protein
VVSRLTPSKSSETRTARSPAAARCQQPCCGEARGGWEAATAADSEERQGTANHAKRREI